MSKVKATTQLNTALGRLEVLMQAIADDLIQEIYQSQIRDNTLSQAYVPSLVQKVLSFTSSLFSSIFSPAPQRMSKEEFGLIFQQISSVLPLIEVMKGGSPDQQKLAERAIQVIEKHNKFIDEISKKVPSSFLKDPENLICKKIEIARQSLPSSRCVKAHTTFSLGVDGTVRSLFAENLLVSEVNQLSLREEDLCRMRAISHLKDSMELKRAIQAVKQAPIEKKWDATQNMFVAVQTVTTIPGVDHVITCEFNSKNVLVKSKCALSIQQTGFPMACQYTGGFILSSCLVDEKFHEQQRALACALLPEGNKYEMAITFIDLKKEVFYRYKEEFLRLHQNKIYNLVTLALSQTPDGKTIFILENFFNKLRSTRFAFEVLGETFQIISTHVIDKQMTEEEIFSMTSACTPEVGNFIQLIAKLLVPSIHRILSKSTLTQFDHYILEEANNQQLEFFKELNQTHNPTVEETAQRMKELLK